MRDLILFRGMPGSDLIPTASLLCEQVHAVGDDIESREHDLEKVNFAMSLGRRVVSVAGSFVDQSDMQDYFDLAASHGYTVHTVVVENRSGIETPHGKTQGFMQWLLDAFEVIL